MFIRDRLYAGLLDGADHARRTGPGPHGPDCRDHLRRVERHEDAMNRSRIVLWVNSISTELAFQAMGLGVRGILRKTLPTELQVKCLQKVQAGELWFEKALTDSFLCARRVALTQREGQLVSLLSQGLKNKEIATTLMISEGTVKVYLSRLFQKVGVKDRFELALFGLKNLTTGQLPVGEKGQRLGPSACLLYTSDAADDLLC